MFGGSLLFQWHAKLRYFYIEIINEVEAQITERTLQAQTDRYSIRVYTAADTNTSTCVEVSQSLISLDQAGC